MVWEEGADAASLFVICFPLLCIYLGEEARVAF